MSQLKIVVVLLVSILLQLSLREVWQPLSYIDFPLVVVVYIALQRDAWQALVVGTLAGLVVDAASGGLVGAGGFSKTLTAYIIYFAATRVLIQSLSVAASIGATWGFGLMLTAIPQEAFAQDGSAAGIAVKALIVSGK